MVTGIECAGIVLAVLPLLVTGLQACSTGSKSIKNSRKYQSILRQYSLDLECEETQFRNTWFRIVQLAGSHSSQLIKIAPGLNLQLFGKDPAKAVAGRGIDMRAILTLALQGFAAAGLEVIERTFEEISNLITELAADFYTITSGDEEFSKDFEFISRVIRERPGFVDVPTSGSTPADHKAFKKIIKKLDYMVRIGRGGENWSAKLSQIKERNRYLSGLVTGDTVAQTFAAYVCERPAVRSTRTYNEIQVQAKALSSVLQEGFQPYLHRCCPLGHSGYLKLQVREICNNSRATPAVMDVDRVWYRFGLSFSFEIDSTRQDVCTLELEIVETYKDRGGQGARTSCSSRHQSSSLILNQQIIPAEDARDADQGITKGKGKVVEGYSDIKSQMSGQQRLPQMLQSRASPEPKGEFSFGSGDKRSVDTSIHPILSRQSLRSMLGSSKARDILNLGLFRRPLDRSSSPDVGLSSVFELGQTCPIPGVVPVPEEKNSHGNSSTNVLIPNIIISPSNSNNLSIGCLLSQAISIKSPMSCRSCAVSNEELLSSLCTAAEAAIQEEGRRGCVGILSDGGEVHIRVCPRGGGQLERGYMETVTLQDILSQLQPPSIGDKLRLAVLLGTSIMQLHETIWLSESWSSKHIYFKKRDVGDVCLIEPYLKGSLQAARTSASTESIMEGEDEWSDCMLCCNQTLFKFGIILIEIFYWKKFEDLENGRRKSKAVREIVAELFRNAGVSYGLAVQTCIQGLPCTEMDLQHEGFKNAVYEKIVAPLEDNLKHFFGAEGLSTIFNPPVN